MIGRHVALFAGALLRTARLGPARAGARAAPALALDGGRGAGPATSPLMQLQPWRGLCSDAAGAGAGAGAGAPLTGPPDKLLLMFTCKVCDTRASKHISKHAYENGSVMVECPGCAKHHLVVDHLGFFGDNRFSLDEHLREKHGTGIPRISVTSSLTEEEEARAAAGLGSGSQSEDGSWMEEAAEVVEGSDEGVLELGPRRGS